MWYTFLQNQRDKWKNLHINLTPEMSEDTAVFSRISPSGKYLIEYHRSVCIGAGSCAAIAENTFEMDNDNRAVLKGEGEDLDEVILAAAQSCPVLAIIVKDPTTGEQIFPPVY